MSPDIPTGSASSELVAAAAAVVPDNPPSGSQPHTKRASRYRARLRRFSESMASKSERRKMKRKTKSAHTLNARHSAPIKLDCHHRENTQDYDISYKILILGDSGVGKTSIIRNITGRDFLPSMGTTIGIDYVKRVFTVDGVRVQMQIWDTPGQERFRTITKFQYSGVKGVILLYDTTKKETFDTLKYWLNSIDQDIDGDSNEPVPVYIVGNKSDNTAARVITTQQGRQVADKHYCNGFYETSAKSGQNIERIFQEMAHSMTEVYHPKMMDAYMSPWERKQKYDKLAEQQVCNGKCACGGIPYTGGRVKVKPPKTKPKWKTWLCIAPNE